MPEQQTDDAALDAPVWGPRWIEEALVTRCRACVEHPGHRHPLSYSSRRAPCPACHGAAFIVLATRSEAATGASSAASKDPS